MCNGYQVAFPWVKWPERGFDNTIPSGTGSKERVELWRLYYPFLLSWPLRDRIAPLKSKIFVITYLRAQNIVLYKYELDQLINVCPTAYGTVPGVSPSSPQEPVTGIFLITLGKYTPSDLRLLLPFSISGQNSEGISYVVLLCYMIRPPISPQEDNIKA